MFFVAGASPLEKSWPLETPAAAAAAAAQRAHAEVDDGGTAPLEEAPASVPPPTLRLAVSFRPLSAGLSDVLQPRESGANEATGGDQVVAGPSPPPVSAPLPAVHQQQAVLAASVQPAAELPKVKAAEHQERVDEVEQWLPPAVRSEDDAARSILLQESFRASSDPTEVIPSPIDDVPLPLFATRPSGSRTGARNPSEHLQGLEAARANTLQATKHTRTLTWLNESSSPADEEAADDVATEPLFAASRQPFAASASVNRPVASSPPVPDQEGAVQHTSSVQHGADGDGGGGKVWDENGEVSSHVANSAAGSVGSAAGSSSTHGARRRVQFATPVSTPLSKPNGSGRTG